MMRFTSAVGLLLGCATVSDALQVERYRITSSRTDKYSIYGSCRTQRVFDLPRWRGLGIQGIITAAEEVNSAYEYTAPLMAACATRIPNSDITSIGMKLYIGDFDSSTCRPRQVLTSAPGDPEVYADTTDIVVEELLAQTSVVISATERLEELCAAGTAVTVNGQEVIPGVTTTATLSGQVRDETDPWRNDGFGNVWFSIEEEYDLEGTPTLRGLACCSITQTSQRYIDRMTKRFRLPEVTAENLA